jgi:hypothetical protein
MYLQAGTSVQAFVPVFKDLVREGAGMMKGGVPLGAGLSIISSCDLVNHDRQGS